ncbi:MAG: pilus assembly protein PilM [Planctomycetes bacterium]|nr:pilus assembly protein PilM [Planctomycetota bacterium]
MLSKRVVTLNFESNSIRILAVRGKKIEKWGSVPLEAGIVKDGLIVQPEAAAEAIKSQLEKMGIKEKKVILSVTGLRATFRVLNLPRVKKSLLEESIHRGAKREMPVPLEELYLSWQSIGNNDGEQNIFVLGMPQELVDAEIRTLDKLGIKPQAMDFKPLVLARLVNRKDALIVDLEPDSFVVTLVADGIPAVIRTITPKGEGSILDDNIWRLNEEIMRIVEYHNRNHRQNHFTTDTPALLTGSLTSDTAIAQAVESGIGYPVEPLTVPFSYPLDFPVAEYAVNIGLASRSSWPMVSKGGAIFSSNNIALNVLPDKYCAKPFPMRYACASFALVLAFGGLFPAYHTAGDADVETETLQMELDGMNDRFQEIARTTDAQRSVENTISSITARAQNLEHEIQSVVGNSSNYGNTAQLVVDALPALAQLTSIKIGVNQIILDGNADSPSRVIDYAKSLEGMNVFASVFISNLGNTFTIIVDL